jgi:hypothetical protein
MDKMKRGLDDDIEDYFTMQERKTAKAVPPAPRAPLTDPPPPIEQQLDITVQESPGECGPDTIVEQINKFWNGR